ncbi:MAG: hypothetical protein J7L39_02205 [Candidatus Aenigmarchaeota archaeon]|nr:hypothetical protein [Candidatus Aenigmarchaeota archaeon]
MSMCLYEIGEIVEVSNKRKALVKINNEVRRVEIRNQRVTVGDKVILVGDLIVERIDDED